MHKPSFRITQRVFAWPYVLPSAIQSILAIRKAAVNETLLHKREETKGRVCYPISLFIPLLFHLSLPNHGPPWPASCCFSLQCYYSQKHPTNITIFASLIHPPHYSTALASLSPLHCFYTLRPNIRDLACFPPPLSHPCCGHLSPILLLLLSSLLLPPVPTLRPGVSLVHALLHPSYPPGTGGLSTSSCSKLHPACNSARVLPLGPSLSTRFKYSCWSLRGRRTQNTAA